MCGIVGKASVKAIEDLPLLERQRNSLRQRGPDVCGLWCSADRCIAFGHRRLAIIDKGRANSERLFALVLFELWCREYRVSF